MRRLKAFTLIELLVVIAIIAILAAILFPVFAQAKEAAKKAAALTQVKQMGTSVNIYAADYDDMMPASITRRAAGTWRYNVPHPYNIPNVLVTALWNTPDLTDAAGSYWASSIQPYIKNWTLPDVPGTNTWNIFAENYQSGTPKYAGIFNGLMSTLSFSQVNAPSTAVMFWEGFGKDASVGRVWVNPILNCGGTTDSCRFNPSGGPQSPFVPAFGDWGSVTAGNNGGSFWMYAKTQPVVRTDSSAKSVRVGSTVNTGGVTPNPGNIWNDPFALISPTGGFGTAPSNAVWYGCSTNGTTGSYYWCYFRPDREQ